MAQLSPRLPVRQQTFSLITLKFIHFAFSWDYKAAELGNRVNVTTFWINLFAKIGWAYDLKQPSQELIRKTIEKHGKFIRLLINEQLDWFESLKVTEAIPFMVTEKRTSTAINTLSLFQRQENQTLAIKLPRVKSKSWDQLKSTFRCLWLLETPTTIFPL